MFPTPEICPLTITYSPSQSKEKSISLVGMTNLRSEDVLPSKRKSIRPLSAVEVTIAKGVFPAEMVPVSNIVSQD